MRNPGNPGIMRIGMFVTATFHGLQKQAHATVPAPAILHLHDRDWVYVPAGGAQFRRVEVVGGNMLPGNLQEVSEHPAGAKSGFERPGLAIHRGAVMDREQVRARIEEIGIIPAIRVSSAEDARFAAEAVYRAGLPIAEITMTVPGAIESDRRTGA